jgi:hypothetical protein
MRTFYSTTKPGWYDSEEISEAKLVQLKTQGALDDSSLEVIYQNTEPNYYDSKLNTLQKTLQASH